MEVCREQHLGGLHMGSSVSGPGGRPTREINININIILVAHIFIIFLTVGLVQSTAGHRLMNSGPCDPLFCEEDSNLKVGDPDNCTNYYECVRGVIQHEKCQGHTYFDTVKAQCVEQSEATCQGPCSGPTTVSTTVPTTQSPAPCNPLPICNLDDKEGDPTSCEHYFWCVNGEYQRHQCGSGTYFDTVTTLCLFPNDATCQGPCPTLPELPSIPPTIDRVPGPCEEDVEECASGVGEGIWYPDQVRCHIYYVCIHQVLDEQDCPPGTVFDFYQQYCVIHKDDSIDCINRCNRHV